jgi:hypothetical protein
MLATSWAQKQKNTHYKTELLEGFNVIQDGLLPVGFFFNSVSEDLSESNRNDAINET